MRTKLKQAILLVVLVSGTLALERLMRPDPAAHAAKARIAAAVQAAQDKLPRPPATISLLQTEQLARDLRAIDATGAPASLRAALNAYAAAVERHASNVRATGIWDTNTGSAIGEAQAALLEALTKERWVP